MSKINTYLHNYYIITIYYSAAIRFNDPRPLTPEALVLKGAVGIIRNKVNTVGLDIV